MVCWSHFKTEAPVDGASRTSWLRAHRARGFELEVWAVDPQVDESSFDDAGVRRVGTLDELLTVCDIVSLHLPADPDGPPVITSRELGLMPPGAMLVNTSRGALVDIPDLLASLEAGHLGAAALDVLPVEPPTD